MRGELNEQVGKKFRKKTKGMTGESEVTRLDKKQNKIDESKNMEIWK